MTRTRVGLFLIVCLLTAGAVSPLAGAATGSAVPQAGDWEGVGPHGLPLSFELARHGGQVVATALAVGYPGSCPAVARDANGVPLSSPLYAGPGGKASPGIFSYFPPAVLAGRLPRSNHQVYLNGSFASARTGSFSIKNPSKLGCGWPATLLSWSVHRATRRAVADGTWTGPLTATGLINGNVRLVVGAGGRVVESFTTFFTCLTDTAQGNTNFRAVPANEFITPRGSFASPLTGGLVKGHRVTWSGTFSASRKLSGAVSVFDDCTNQMIHAHFTGRRTKP